ncbi:hypothetical protein K0M31_008328 [Melipona bicolor]|uniref:Uncharacterized protein n=1 Tax=Melipona bicolor TaxID=60889 RepID=A0AA40FRH2_9HYME|nr:hypothetical protein K0M31_008328 [Melipona bicolor]
MAKELKFLVFVSNGRIFLIVKYLRESSNVNRPSQQARFLKLKSSKPDQNPSHVLSHRSSNPSETGSFHQNNLSSPKKSTWQRQIFEWLLQVAPTDPLSQHPSHSLDINWATGAVGLSD